MKTKPCFKCGQDMQRLPNGALEGQVAPDVCLNEHCIFFGLLRITWVRDAVSTEGQK